ncbi:hypothetical protein LshimejAT787_1500480 [Lyophyllum shimeji]|uniref:DUF6532 domain-containing protein n=1 Tax=Lyophyllum shimeji TaxID=47721 RepID=A0A9P3PYD6_LYOSH|nr:hypothetical protein LshimejAT787_1500480 [Lyophyllum shimeji]
MLLMPRLSSLASPPDPSPSRAIRKMKGTAGLLLKPPRTCHWQLPPPPPPRERRPSDKLAAQLQYNEEEAARQAEKARKRAERLKKVQQKHLRKAADVPEDGDAPDEREDTIFTSTIVSSKPAARKELVPRKSKVPPALRQAMQEHHAATDDEQDEAAEQEPRGRSRHRTRSLSRHRTNPCTAPRSASMGSAGSMPPLHSVSRSRSRSSSPSPSAGDKRRRSPDDEGPTPVQAQKVTANTGRPKAADYDDDVQELITRANSLYRCFLSTVVAFPDSATELDAVKQAWKVANEESGLPAPVILSADIAKVIKNRGSQLRGEAKTRVLPLVEAMYNFDSGHSKKAINMNRTRAEDLKEGKGFIYKMLADEEGKRRGIYGHDIIQKGINGLWFKNKNDAGIIYQSYFDPMPNEAIAFVLTAIECGIDHWLTGIKTDIEFRTTEYKSVYQSHLDSLKAFGEHTKKYDLLGKLRKKLYKNGRIHAGAPPVASLNAPTIPVSAFEDAMKEYEEDSATEDDSDAENGDA